MKTLNRLLPLAAALVLAGCATALPPLPKAVDTPPQFKELRQNERWTIAQPAEAQSRGTWWKAFNDPVLDELIERAGAGNTDIQQSAARLAQARALLRGAQADRAPQIGAGASANRGAGADTANGPTPATLLQAGLNLSYEVDLFGRLSRAQDAASLDAQSREALLQSTRLLVQAEVAQTYLALRATDTERALVQDTATAYADTLRLTQRRFEAGDVAELDVIRIQTEQAATEAEVIALDRVRAELEHALAVLLGEPASGFSLAPTATARALPVIPPGVPATVLARRPDVAAAQASLLAAQARVGVAQAAWFPRVSLTGAAGFASPELGELFQWSARSWGVGALLSLPLFDGGRREAGVQNARAEFDAVSAQYRGQVLNALREVEDQLSSLRLLHEQSLAQGRAVSAAQRASAISETRYRNGLVSQLELLDARRNELLNRRQAQRVEAAQQQATVRLIRALGGGWADA
ncbi:MAG: efflux transporter outer membrane subunit [Hydrogenophaga sp.]|uniref:efflux transporter outer membrane subunit n=1 Tax=Hydrogenophaga sp. TaxID=1904254 RepID=UPI0016912BC8|nr:efflux transporter outer membrane subunit [Hydrogenophaga sp.]NIM42950.1 efflux transporter outer membrane subunit [Hydrogenophaga sp.]NIN27880.1 efflux transporter outer membrane subunit [Hydrogenophaga sp.]NIN29561.1 efflux transporter outer membrane subunit [Hydrogenophaga sp.]NIN57153.1 efflux transporter outer membrane subunit [Hydrogenophaga sp.]NIO53564.1 efflux transporter outer membrane subunit [Hydrogenophaga sp.]